MTSVYPDLFLGVNMAVLIIGAALLALLLLEDT